MVLLDQQLPENICTYYSSILVLKYRFENGSHTVRLSTQADKVVHRVLLNTHLLTYVPEITYFVQRIWLQGIQQCFKNTHNTAKGSFFLHNFLLPGRLYFQPITKAVLKYLKAQFYVCCWRYNRLHGLSHFPLIRHFVSHIKCPFLLKWHIFIDINRAPVLEQVNNNNNLLYVMKLRRAYGTPMSKWIVFVVSSPTMWLWIQWYYNTTDEQLTLSNIAYTLCQLTQSQKHLNGERMG